MAIAVERLLVMGLAISHSQLFISLSVQAQSIIPDGSLGAESSRLHTTVEDDTPVELIEGGASRGPNLFHSFEAFGINAGQQVYFANPGGIEQIFGRVTGDSISQIDGTLGVLGAADLFLLNPNGVVFGSGARLDLSGSFTVSTAGRVLFTDGSEFTAVPGAGDGLLSVSVPVGLQSNAQPQGGITTAGQLEVGGSLMLLGSQLNLSGRLASGKDLILLGEGEIRAEAEFESGGDLQFLQASGELGNLVAERSPRMVAGDDVQFGDYVGRALKVTAGGSIEAGNIRTTGPDLSLVADGSGSDEDLLASGRAAILRAGLSAVDGESADRESSGSITVGSVNASNFEGGDGGAIVLAAEGKIQTVAAFESPFISSTRRIALGAFAFSNSGNTGNAGKILISSLKGDVNIAQDINTISHTFRGEKTGDGGMIYIYSKYGNVTVSGQLSSSSRSGDGGKITAVSDFGNLEIDSFNSSSSLDDSGTVSFSSKHGNIRINNTSSASSNAIFGNAGNGGDIVISSRNGLIEVDGSLLSNSSTSSAFFGFAGLFLPAGDTQGKRKKSQPALCLQRKGRSEHLKHIISTH